VYGADVAVSQSMSPLESSSIAPVIVPDTAGPYTRWGAAVEDGKISFELRRVTNHLRLLPQ
jgi:hypothetical protein